MPETKKIDFEKATEAISCLKEIPPRTISMREFVVKHFDELEKTGQPLGILHRFLLSKGIDVGSFLSFRSVYTRIKSDRKKL